MYTYKEDLWSSHSAIIRFATSKRKMTILDIGCAQGYIAQALAPQGHKMYGIELDKKAAEQAKKFYTKVFIGNIETKNFPLQREFFDLIVFGDILEHTTQPDFILKKYLSYLKKGGKVIVSVPNIANIYTRINLFFGRFDYKDKGILDRTHSRFFTLASIKKIVKNAGLKIESIETTPIPLPLLLLSTAQGHPLHFLHTINYFFTGIWKTLFGYQFVILATKR